MEWWVVLLIFFGGLIIIMMSGMEIFAAFLIGSAVAMGLLWRGIPGMEQTIINLTESIAKYAFLPIPLFVLMGHLMYNSQVAPRLIDALDKWIGRLPGRLGLEAIAGGTIIAALTGGSIASVAILGSTLAPEMEKRGYKKSMSLGPILGSGGLAIMIPPSGLAVFLGVVADISIGRLLIGIIVPGLIMSALYAIYTVGRCRLQPHIAPAYDVPPLPLREKVMALLKYVLPMGFIVFLVTGVIFFGIATPTEAGATGAAGTFILAAAYKRLSWQVVKKSLIETAITTSMIMLLLGGAASFSQILIYTGGGQGLVNSIMSFGLSPTILLVAMMVVATFLGMFVSVHAVVMITIPLYMPIIRVVGIDPIWFGVVMMLASEMAVTTPPFGTALFTMLSVAPPGTQIGDIYKAGLPYLACDVICMVFLIAFPVLTLWLPELMWKPITA